MGISAFAASAARGATSIATVCCDRPFIPRQRHQLQQDSPIIEIDALAITAR
jgi:hypothetical protein